MIEREQGDQPLFIFVYTVVQPFSLVELASGPS